MTLLYLVIPCYNEQEVLPETSRRLKEKLTGLIEKGAVHPDSRILFVDDGSKDATWPMIQELSQREPLMEGLKLSRNRGHQNAVLAGLMTAKDYADAVISMDADLQDDINAIDAFLERYEEGNQVVYGVRSSRQTDTFFKRATAEGFYKFMAAMGVEVVFNHADYRLMSKRALEALSQYKEVNLFLRGIVPLIGFKSAVVPYERAERFAGESKYPLKKMLALAFDGITSFSIKPIRLISVLGGLLFAGGLISLLVFLILWLFGMGVEGWYVVAGTLWMLAGVQLLAAGIVGSYVGKIYQETKARPRYFIETFTGEEEKR